jgi:hypothetical protein
MTDQLLMDEPYLKAYLNKMTVHRWWFSNSRRRKCPTVKHACRERDKESLSRAPHWPVASLSRTGRRCILTIGIT